MEPETPKDCPECQSPAKVCNDSVKTGNYFVGCSNELDCPKWPVTRSHPTEAEAIAAWNRGETL